MGASCASSGYGHPCPSASPKNKCAAAGNRCGAVVELHMGRTDDLNDHRGSFPVRKPLTHTGSLTLHPSARSGQRDFVLPAEIIFNLHPEKILILQGRQVMILSKHVSPRVLRPCHAHTWLPMRGAPRFPGEEQELALMLLLPRS